MHVSHLDIPSQLHCVLHEYLAMEFFLLCQHYLFTQCYIPQTDFARLISLSKIQDTLVLDQGYMSNEYCQIPQIFTIFITDLCRPVRFQFLYLFFFDQFDLCVRCRF